MKERREKDLVSKG